MKRFLFYIAAILAAPCSALAQIGDNINEIAVMGAICERITNGESKASARVRATDKASFKAVEEIPELSLYREALDTHNFNLKVYRLVDNYLEDINITTTSQDAGRVCVEVNAYLSRESIAEVFAEDTAEDEPVEDEQMPDITAQTDKELALELESEDVVASLKLDIPPKPQITIHKKIAYEKEATKVTEPNEKAADVSDKTVVFIDKTEFYNGDSTKGFFAYLEQELAANKNIVAAASLNNPDYILKTKVLKAKIDNVNSETSRLQIVVAVELTDMKTSETLTDHQNRFILFEAQDDAQKTAAELTKKLLSAGVAKLLPKIKTKESSQGRGNIITPN